MHHVINDNVALSENMGFFDRHVLYGISSNEFNDNNKAHQRNKLICVREYFLTVMWQLPQRFTGDPGIDRKNFYSFWSSFCQNNFLRGNES